MISHHFAKGCQARLTNALGKAQHTTIEKIIINHLPEKESHITQCQLEKAHVFADNFNCDHPTMTRE
jgi:hypothetical protein